MKATVMDEVKKTFRPEFLNRLDDIIIFKHLLKDELHRILELMLKELSKRVSEKSMELELSLEVKDKLVKDGYSPAYGARPMRRILQKLIEDALAEEILAGKFKEGDKITAILKHKNDVPEGVSVAKLDTSSSASPTQEKKDDDMVVLFEKSGTVEIKLKYERKGDPPKVISISKEEPAKEAAKTGSTGQ